MERLKVLYYDSFTTHDSIGVKSEAAVPVIQWLSERGRTKRPSGRASGDFGTLKQCTNCRDQLLIMLLAETGYRIGEIFRGRLYQRY